MRSTRHRSACHRRPATRLSLSTSRCTAATKLEGHACGMNNAHILSIHFSSSLANRPFTSPISALSWASTFRTASASSAGSRSGA
jgi:hypothetical protein